MKLHRKRANHSSAVQQYRWYGTKTGPGIVGTDCAVRYHGYSTIQSAAIGHQFPQEEVG